jgi:hypothetical protein
LIHQNETKYFYYSNLLLLEIENHLLPAPTSYSRSAGKAIKIPPRSTIAAGGRKIEKVDLG